MLRVLAPLWGEEADRTCLNAALRVASAGGAQVLALAPEIDPVASLAWVAGAEGFLSSSVVELMENDIKTRARQAENAVADARARLPAAPADAIEYRQTRGVSVGDIVADACATVDIAVFVDNEAFGKDRRPAFQSALIGAQTPCLVVRNDDVHWGRIAIAWDGSAHAGRALRAALPLILAHKQATLLYAPAGLSHHRRATAAPDDLRRLLARLGVETDMPKISADATDGSALLKLADSVGASLFIAGAFGHSRAQEFLFGGATQCFVDARGGPSLLLAH